jgi:hypothetical protein
MGLALASVAGNCVEKRSKGFASGTPPERSGFYALSRSDGYGFTVLESMPIGSAVQVSNKL